MVINRWMNNENATQIHNRILLSSLKKKRNLQKNGYNWEMLNEVIQAQKDECYTSLSYVNTHIAKYVCLGEGNAGRARKPEEVHERGKQSLR